MPLAFNSQSHGVLAFGFFHIETHLLLLDELFLWADDFCALVESLAQADPGQGFSGQVNGFRIRGRENLGDLHGAIAGQELWGFIGALYAKEPFPQEPQAFRQKTKGNLAPELVRDMALKFGQEEVIPVTAQADAQGIALGEYSFDRTGFGDLVTYVWRGGMPGWQDGQRPDFVTAMAKSLRAAPGTWFQGLALRAEDVGYRM